MSDGREHLPRALAVAEEGMRQGLHIGAQVYASLRGAPVADFAIGEAKPGTPLTPESMPIWFSCTKAPTAVALAQQCERGALELDDPVVRFIPEFGQHGKGDVTVRHVLTHGGGFRFADQGAGGALEGPFAAGWDEIIARICNAPLEPGWVPGRRAGYHPTSGWFILGEIVHRLDGRPFSAYVREEVFEPAGMVDSWVGIPPERMPHYASRLVPMHNTERDRAVPMTALNSEPALSRCVPGGGGRGPIHDLGRLYEMLLNRGAIDGRRLLSPQTVEAITARHRVDMLDETFQTKLDWGLGFILDSKRYGLPVVPYGYGAHASPRTVGHGGAQSSVGFMDPEHGLVVAAVFNGMPGGPKHNRRMWGFLTALYEDLDLGTPAAAATETPA
jgi:CubicO group peptidase (beta-lactamase class C family)